MIKLMDKKIITFLHAKRFLIWAYVFFCRMRPLDIAFMKAVHHKVNIVPVIAKADTLTKKEVLNLKRRVSTFNPFRNNGIFHLRNECNFWKVYGIMNTSGLMQSKGLHVNFVRDPKYS